MFKYFAYGVFLVNITLCNGQENEIKMSIKSSFYVIPKVELYSLTWEVKGSDFTSRLTWNNNINAGVSFGYQKTISDKIFFSEIGISNTISGKGTDIDRFNSGAKIETEFQSDKSMFINVRMGAQLIKNPKEKLGILLQLSKDNLKLHSNTYSDLNSRYVIRKSNLGLNYNYSINLLNIIAVVDIQGGVGYNYAIATWNTIESLKQPKSFDHSIFLYDLGLGCTIEICPNLSLSTSFRNNSLIWGREKTFLKDGNIQELNFKTFSNRTVTFGFKYKFL